MGDAELPGDHPLSPRFAPGAIRTPINKPATVDGGMALYPGFARGG